MSPLNCTPDKGPLASISPVKIELLKLAALRTRIRAASEPGIIAARKNWPPFLALQICAALIVVAYYSVDPFHDAMRGLAQAKTNGGLAFVWVAGMLAGSIVPECAKMISGRVPKFGGAWLQQMAFNAFVYGIVAVQVDLFYQLQTLVFGSGRDPLTLAVKTAVDMSLFSTLISIPTAFALFDWRSGGWSKARRLFTVEGYIDRIVPALIPCWVFWIPILLSVYSLPADLQFCLSQIAEAAWSILFIFIATDQHLPELEGAAAGG
jgi:hypothetical protein